MLRFDLHHPVCNGFMRKIRIGHVCVQELMKNGSKESLKCEHHAGKLQVLEKRQKIKLRHHFPN